MLNSPDSEKPYELKIENRKDYLYAAVKSHDGCCRDATGDYISEIGVACRKDGCVRLLIEKIVPNTLWLWDSMFVMGQFPKIGLSAIKVVLVDKSAGNFEPAGFTVSVGDDSPVDLHVFSSFAAAENWLCQ